MPADNSVTLLIAEDSDVMIAALGHLLSQYPEFKTLAVAKDGEGAVEAVQRMRPNVVLMDIELPGMSGIDATRKIKELVPETKVVMLTVHDADSDIFPALAAGAHGYCLKTVNAEQLSIAIRTVYDGAAWLDPKIARRVFDACTSAAPPTDSARPSGTPAINLTPRELDVLRHVVDGLTNHEIADRLFLSVETVKSHMRNIMDKLAVSDRTQAAVKAVRENLI